MDETERAIMTREEAADLLAEIADSLVWQRRRLDCALRTLYGDGPWPSEWQRARRSLRETARHALWALSREP